MSTQYSVIIPTIPGRDSMLQRSLASVLGQTVPPSEIIIVLDAEFGEATELPSSDRWRVIKQTPRKGAAAARNRGLAEAACELVAFLDDDDEWHPNKMENQLQYLSLHPNSVAVTGGYERHEHGHRYTEIFSETFVRDFHLYDTFLGSFSFAVVKRCSDGNFLKLNESLPAFQDWEYYLRLSEHGEIGYVSKNLGIYHAHSGPRVTLLGGSRYRGLRRVYCLHKRYMPDDARRWCASRLMFMRSEQDNAFVRRVRRVYFATKLCVACRLPWRVKLRSLAKQWCGLLVSHRRLEAIRAAVFGVLNWVDVFCRCPIVKHR